MERTYSKEDMRKAFYSGYKAPCHVDNIRLDGIPGKTCFEIWIDHYNRHTDPEWLRINTRNMKVIAEALNKPFHGEWYECKGCLANNLTKKCRGCGCEDMTRLFFDIKNLKK